MIRVFRFAMGAMLGAALALSSTPALAATHQSPDRSPDSSATASAKIKHIFVIVEEGHSFDNYFATFAGEDGIDPKKLQVPIDPGTAGGRTVGLHAIGAGGAAPVASDYRTARVALNGGRMNGFAAAQSGNGKGADSGLGYYTPAQVDAYWELAKNYTLMDRFFS